MGAGAGASGAGFSGAASTFFSSALVTDLERDFFLTTSVSFFGSAKQRLLEFF
jgi:hypothetical protein